MLQAGPAKKLKICDFLMCFEVRKIGNFPETYYFPPSFLPKNTPLSNFFFGMAEKCQHLCLIYGSITSDWNIGQLKKHLKIRQRSALMRVTDVGMFNGFFEDFACKYFIIIVT